jgi:hypothetical protein
VMRKPRQGARTGGKRLQESTTRGLSHGEIIEVPSAECKVLSGVK